MQTITQATIEAAKEALLTVREADNPVNSARPVHAVPRTDD